MSGVRRRTKYRKSTMRSVTDEFPEPDENEYIVMALGSRGSNIFEVRMSFLLSLSRETGKRTAKRKQIRLPDDSEGLAMLPTKFRKLVWVKRGMFLIVSGDPDAKYETASGEEGRVRYIIEHILLEEQENYLRSTTHWPENFIEKKTKKDEEDEEKDDKDEDGEEDYMKGVFRNRNRRHVLDSDESSSEEDSSEEED